MGKPQKFLCTLIALFGTFTLLTSFPSAAQSLTQSLGDALVTRTYKLDAEKIQKLDTTILNKPPGQRRPSEILRALLQYERIEIPATSTNTTASATAATERSNQKSFHFNEAAGELTLRASRRDIPKFEKYLSQISADPPAVDTDTFVVNISDGFDSCVMLFPTNLISVTNQEVLTPNQFETLLGRLPTNSLAYAMPATATLTTFSGRPLRIVDAEELLPQTSSPIIPILASDKSLFIRGDTQ